MEELLNKEGPVRVFTVCDESRHLIVKNVPALGCTDELLKLLESFGPIEEYNHLDEEDCEPFTDVYLIKFTKVISARFAKRKLDKFNFIGNLLEVTYAPEYESLLDTKEKLEERKHAVSNRISGKLPAKNLPNLCISSFPDQPQSTKMGSSTFKLVSSAGWPAAGQGDATPHEKARTFSDIPRSNQEDASSQKKPRLDNRRRI